MSALSAAASKSVDSGGFLAKVPEFAKSGHPRLAARLVGPKLISDGLGNKCAERNPTPSGCGLRAAKYGIGNFKRRLHATILPYLWAIRASDHVFPSAAFAPEPTPALYEIRDRAHRVSQRTNCGWLTPIPPTAFWLQAAILGLTLVTTDRRLLGIGAIATLANR